ncbi:MAG: MGMT family protein [Bacteroidia bacterium]|nr:MGMT family protein [Bacteroidia bacterium]
MSKNPDSKKVSRNDFYESVYEIVRLIPRGRVTNYGAIAKVLGTAGAARMVGYAMNHCLNRQDVPAHRVVNRAGLLTGRHHFPEENSMQQRLEAEGLVVIDNQIQHFDQHFWDPMSEIEL